MTKPNAHFTDAYLLHPTNPVVVNLIGAGGTGSQVLTALARINHSLAKLGHAGLFVRVFDDDIITDANLGRQLFAESELGLHKAVALINRLNRFFGTNWKAIPLSYTKNTPYQLPDEVHANITITCVDTAQARFEIAEILLAFAENKDETHNKPLYWLDFGNSRHTGQVVLSTVGHVKQPASKKYTPISNLPFVTEEYKELLQSTDKSDTPSCSLAEALTKQDLFINSTLANMGASLLWQMFREGIIAYRGYFLNLKEFISQPIPVT